MWFYFLSNDGADMSVMRKKRQSVALVLKNIGVNPSIFVQRSGGRGLLEPETLVCEGIRNKMAKQSSSLSLYVTELFSAAEQILSRHEALVEDAGTVQQFAGIEVMSAKEEFLITTSFPRIMTQ